MRPMRAPDRRAAHRRRNCRRTTRACRAIYKRTFVHLHSGDALLEDACDALSALQKTDTVHDAACGKITASLRERKHFQLVSLNADARAVDGEQNLAVRKRLYALYAGKSQLVSVFQGENALFCFALHTLLYARPVPVYAKKSRRNGRIFSFSHYYVTHSTL